MPQRVRAATLADVSGGLNLRVDGFQLAANESPDMMNVDLDVRGGWKLRKGVNVVNTTALADAITSAWTFLNSSGTAHLMCAAGTALHYSTGANFSTIATITQTAGLRHSAVTFKDNCYIQNGTNGAVRWDGTTATRLSATFNDNIAAPNQGDMPTARYVCSHMGRVWVAYTNESGTSYPNRVRFSHVNQPEDWRTNDYIDIDTGADGDSIQAIVPFGDRLYVFKRHAVYVIAGYDQDTFQVFPVSRDYGVCGPDAVVSTEAGIFFFDWPSGLHVLRGGAPDYLFDKLRPALDDGTISATNSAGITVGFRNRRVWVSVPWDGTSYNSRTFVLDLTVAKNGAWTAYDVACGQFVNWETGSTSQFLAVDDSTASGRGKRVLKLEQDAVVDSFDGSTNSHIESRFVTAWFDLGEPALPKRWRRPAIICDDRTAATVRVQAYKDFNAYEVTDEFTIITSATGTAEWDSAVWDVDKWVGSEEDRDSLFSGHGLGIARAVRFKFTGPSTNADWAVRSLTMKYVPRRIR